MSIDTMRIIDAIVVGISFLGAGAILKKEESAQVHNLTTAAGILVTAAIGVAIALDRYYLAVGVTLIILCVNRLLLPFKKSAQS